MRRPLKPFVTEYKGTNRRPKDGGGLFGTEPDVSPAETPARKTIKKAEPKSATPSPRRGEAQRSNEQPRYNGGQPEDSYEAAMRAADALFSGGPAKETSPSHLTPTARAVFAPQADAPQPTTDAVPAGGTGRILRVLDEEPDPALLEMEAERTPKRRGRKPGSKNKPKLDAIIVSSEETESEEVFAFESRHDLSGVPAVKPAQANITFFAPPAARSGERFSWVRTKLRPGEAWKRRLPKVIW